TASVSAGTSGAAYLTGAGNLATTANQTLLLGGASTGDIQFKPANSLSSLYLASTGKVGIGNTSPVGKFDLNGAVTGKALAIFNETGDQNILTGSASGT